MAEASAEQHLKKHVGFLGLLAMCVGLNIGGSPLGAHEGTVR